MEPNPTDTRRSLHGLAELLLAGPQYHHSQTIRLQVTPGGFGTVAAPDLRVDQLTLVCSGARVPLQGTITGLARAAGVDARALRDVYAEGPEIGVDDPLVLDPEAARVLLGAFATGDAALRRFAPGEEPTLWPEHFDVAISLAEVNYGISPGDAGIAAPYAYVGPWTPRKGAFWNVAFGAARPLTEMPDVDAVVTFFREGADRALSDPPRAG